MKDKVLTVGFSKSSEREFNVFDPRNIGEPVAHLNIDTSSGGIMPFRSENDVPSATSPGDASKTLVHQSGV